MTHTPQRPPRSPKTLTTSVEDAVLNEACRVLELKSRDARCLHRHSNTVYLLPSEDAVVRIKRGSAERSERAIAVSRWLVEQGFPATAPLAIEQPVVLGGWTVSCWQYYPQVDRPPPEPWRLGELLRHLHALPAPLVELPRYSPLKSLAHQVTSTGCLAADDRAWLLGRREDLLTAYHELDFPLGQGHIHGDAYPGNLLWDGARVVLGDWDEASFGPRELDLVNTYQGVRFGRTEKQLREFAHAYSYDLTQWPGFSILRAIRDLHTLSAYLRRGDQGDQAARHQVLHRVETLRRGELAAQWANG